MSPLGLDDSAREPLSREELQKLRFALVDAVLELSCDGVSLDMVSQRAGIPAEVVAGRFGDLESLCGWAHEENAREFDEMVLAAYERESSWLDGLRAAAYAAARFIEKRPRLVRFGISELLRAGPMAQVVRERQLEPMVEMIDRGRQELEDPESIDRSVAEGVMGAIYGKLTTEVQRTGGPVRAVAYVADMMYVAVRPYLGEQVAREEIRRGAADRARYERGEI